MRNMDAWDAADRTPAGAIPWFEIVVFELGAAV